MKGEEVRKIRDELGLSRIEFAETFGLSNYTSQFQKQMNLFL